MPADSTPRIVGLSSFRLKIICLPIGQLITAPFFRRDSAAPRHIRIAPDTIQKLQFHNFYANIVINFFLVEESLLVNFFRHRNCSVSLLTLSPQLL